MTTLDTRPSRKDMTSRECCSIIGGIIGTLCQNAPIENVRTAVRWWADAEKATWETLGESLQTPVVRVFEELRAACRKAETLDEMKFAVESVLDSLGILG